MIIVNHLLSMGKKRKTGLPPGTVIYTGDKVVANVSITYVSYDEEQHSEQIFHNADKLPLYKSEPDLIQWYDIRGLHDTHLIESIAHNFDIHSLALEDIVDVQKRPSHTEYANGHFISFKSFTYNCNENQLQSQAISLYMGKGFVLSFQEFDDDIFLKIRDRIAQKKGKIRQRDASYLLYALIDLIVDNYYVVTDLIEELLEGSEARISNNVETISKGELQGIKLNLIKLRKSVVPLRDALSQLLRSESDYVVSGTEPYLRDVHSHTIQVSDSIDSLRDILGGLQDLYLSEISLRMNKVMQFLTVVTAIFVPISFLTGLYGMNFDHIPELKHPHGYFILWAVMILLVVGMLWWFRRKKWI